MSGLTKVLVKEECDTEYTKEECIVDEDQSVIKSPNAKGMLRNCFFNDLAVKKKHPTDALF